MQDTSDDDDSAYDAGEDTDDNTFFTGDKTLDAGDDIEDKAEKISVDDIKSAETQPTSTMDTDDSEDIDITVSDEPEKPEVNVRMLVSKATGKPNLVSISNGKIVGTEEIPPQYLELARQNPKMVLDIIKADKAAMIPSDDEALMESIKKDIEREIKRLNK